MSEFFSREPAFKQKEFIGRNATLQWLLRRVLGATPQDINLLGEPRIGKTSILYQIPIRLASVSPMRRSMAIVLSPAEWVQPTPNIFWETLYRKLQKKIQQEDMASSLSPQAQSYDFFQALIDLLNVAINKQNYDRILILIDDFDLLAPHLTPDDFNWLRSLTQHSLLLNHIAFIIASLDSLQKLSRNLQEISPFHNVFAQHRVGLFSSSEATLLVQRAIESANRELPGSSITINQEALQFLIAEAGKHPALLRIITDYYALHTYQHQHIHLDAIRADFRYDEQVLWLFDTLFHRRTPEEQEALIKLAHGQPFANKIVLNHLAYHFGLIEHSNEGYKIFSEAFQDWLRHYTPSSRQPSSLGKQRIQHTPPTLRYFPTLKQLTIGDGEPIQLTRVENRLMSFLIDHVNQVCSQKTILDHVWGSNRNKSVVEKTINRLRSKIEQDPSRPQYLVSVWGQGYMLKHAVKET